jgi:hypothetical protein
MMERPRHLLYTDAAELADGLAEEIREAERSGDSINGLLIFVEARIGVIQEMLKAIKKLESSTP